jgi:Probable cobalt transporter subunit (CbtB)
MDEFVPVAEPIRVPIGAWIAAAVGLALLYIVLQENGALLANEWQEIHELFHDGRHFMGVPCH